MTVQIPELRSGFKPYVNLTSGLEVIADYSSARLVRIQSSHLESYALWKVICDLDYGFLFDAAMSGVALIDCGSRRNAVARAQWQGVPWIGYAYKRANGLPTDGIQFANDFSRAYAASAKGRREDGLKKLRYVRKMTGADTLKIECLSVVSSMDGDYPALSGLLLEHYR